MNKEQMLLLKLMEEASEVQKEASKCIQFGLNDLYQDESGVSKTNRDRLQSEIDDFMAILEMCFNAGITDKFPFSRDEEKVNNKRIKVNKFFDYSKKLGRMKDND